jgi:hypothetical protein
MKVAKDPKSFEIKKTKDFVNIWKNAKRSEQKQLKFEMRMRLQSLPVKDI